MTVGFACTSAGRAFGDLLAEVEHGDRVADAHDDVHVVLDQDQRDAMVADLADDRHQLLDVGRGEAGGRLVEQQELRIESQSAADLEQALLAVGQVARFLVGQLGKADEPEDARRADTRDFFLAALACGVRAMTDEHTRPIGVVQADQHVLDRGHLAEQLHVLERAGDAARARSRAMFGRQCRRPRTR